jgi:hypothetical protein
LPTRSFPASASHYQPPANRVGTGCRHRALGDLGAHSRDHFDGLGNAAVGELDAMPGARRDPATAELITVVRIVPDQTTLTVLEEPWEDVELGKGPSELAPPGTALT